jgi:hypothetical protein
MKRELDGREDDEPGSFDGEHYSPPKAPDYAALGRDIENNLRPKMARLQLTRDEYGLCFKLSLFNRKNLSLHMSFGRLFQKLFRVAFYSDLPPEPGSPREAPQRAYRGPPSREMRRAVDTPSQPLLTLDHKTTYRKIAKGLDLTQEAQQARFRGVVEALEGGRNGVARAASRKRADAYIDWVLHPEKYRV